MQCKKSEKASSSSGQSPRRVLLQEAVQRNDPPLVAYQDRKGSPEISDEPPCYGAYDDDDLLGPLLQQAVDDTIVTLDRHLRELSLKIHAKPEIGFEERYAHDLLTSFMVEHGFDVTPHYLGLETAWRAEYRHGVGGRTLGINSEMDALPGLGHACGHNLIAVAGVGVAIAIKDVLIKYDIAGTVVLLGTPAEEFGGGKIKLLEKGGYEGMAACLMCHPCPSPNCSVRMNNFLALQNVEVEYFGHAAHASFAPWEAQNALDAAFLAYSSISVLRQQMRPEQRVHGIVEGKNWTPNIIPDYAKMRWILRAPTHVEVDQLYGRVKACLEAAALATSCKYKIKTTINYYDLQQNSVLSSAFVDIIGRCYGWSDASLDGVLSASSDFGNVSYAIPSLHPSFGIPTFPHEGNHSAGFAESARTEEAHHCTMITTKALALTGLRILRDDHFYREVLRAFEQQPPYVD